MDEETVQIKYQGHVFVVARNDLIVSDWWFQFPGDARIHRLCERPLGDGFYHVDYTVSPCQAVRK